MGHINGILFLSAKTHLDENSFLLTSYFASNFTHNSKFMCPLKLVWKKKTDATSQEKNNQFLNIFPHVNLLSND